MPNLSTQHPAVQKLAEAIAAVIVAYVELEVQLRAEQAAPRPGTPGAPLLIGMKEAQKLLGGMNYGKLSGLCRAGAIPCVRFGRKWLFPRDRLEEWASDQTSDSE